MASLVFKLMVGLLRPPTIVTHASPQEIHFTDLHIVSFLLSITEVAGLSTIVTHASPKEIHFTDLHIVFPFVNY